MSTEQHGSSARPEEWRPSHNPWLIAIAVMLATFVEVLDTTIVSVATPNIAGALASTNDEATRVLTCYLVANAIILPVSGWLSIRFGRKRLIIGCTVLFAFASFLCGSAPTMPLLLACSALQGLGGGAMVPLAQAILMESFPPAKRGMALAVYSLGLVVAPAAGPVLGGWLTDNYSWRWVFYINVPICIIAAVAMWHLVEDPPYVRNAKAGPVDTFGLALIGVWLASFQFMMDDGQKKDWFGSTYIQHLFWTCTIAFTLMIIRELRVKHPIVDLRVFRDRNFTAGCGIMMASSIAFYSAVTGVPLLLQTLMGYTSQLAGIATAPRGLAAAVMVVFVGYLTTTRVDGRWIIACGLIVLALGTFGLGAINLGVSMKSIVWPCALQGIAMSSIYIPLMAIAMGTLRNDQIANASGIFNLVRNLGGSIGISLTNTFVARGLQVHYERFIPHATVYDPAYQQQSVALYQHLKMANGVQEMAQSQALLQSTLLQQAGVMAYIDFFRWTVAMVVIVAPAAFLLKKVIPRAGVTMH